MPAPKDPEANVLWHKRMSEAKAKSWEDPGYRAARVAERKGKPKSIAHRAAIAAAQIGMCHTPETRALLSEINTGKTLSEDTRKKIGDAHRGKTRTPEHNKAMSEAIKADWESLSLEQRNAKMEACHKFVFGRFPTSLEIKVMNILESNSILYEYEFPISPYSCDFFLPAYNLIIEADGNYWHQDKEAEIKRDAHILAQGYRILHLTESQINTGAENLILEALETVILPT